jgi:hypothetical protein
MNKIYEVHIGMQVDDLLNEQEARRKVEEAEHGYIVTFVRGFDNRDRSCAINVYDNGAWRGVNIHE